MIRILIGGLLCTVALVQLIGWWGVVLLLGLLFLADTFSEYIVTDINK